jgi:allose kinase
MIVKMNDGYIIGVDIGGTNIRIGLVDRDLNMHDFLKANRKDVLYGEEPILRLLEFLQEYIGRNRWGMDVLAVSIGFPSTIDRQRRKVLSTPNIEGLDNVDVADILEKGLGLPVFINKDVCMLFYYDSFHFELPHRGIVIGCYIGTGIGNVLSINGELLIGKDGAACELGHIPVLGRQDICACGNEGCIENYASGKYLEILKEKYFSDISITQIFTQKSKETVIQEFIENVSIPIVTEINLLNPDYIILGGGVLAMDNFPKNDLESYIRKHTRKPLPENNLNILYSVNSNTNGVIGAVLYCKQNYKLWEAELNDRACK